MSRLIDADLFMDFIKEELKQDRPDEIHIRNIIRFLEDLPTAYDVDKVIEQLEEDADVISIPHNFSIKKKVVIDINDAIEIVERGGIDE